MIDMGWDAKEGIFPSLGLTVSWLLAVAHSHNLYVFYPWSVGSLTFYDAAPIHL